tara:strand:- start:1149 stop:1937 length:789 start_codon:yes stop_codon:yes gene_type:complete
MNLISKIIDKYFIFRLKSYKYRKDKFRLAIENKLSNKKISVKLLKNINHQMSKNSDWHEEFKKLIGPRDFQEAFWSSDLSHNWYNNSRGNGNIYYDYAISLINGNNYKSVLDVGCGWGEFCRIISNNYSINRVLGIDISESIINKAISFGVNGNMKFSSKPISEIEEKFDLITFIGCSDYIDPSNIKDYILKAISIASKKIIITNSLRRIPYESVLKINESIKKEIYDIGYVHPLRKILLEINADFKIMKIGEDSQMVIITV